MRATENLVETWDHISVFYQAIICNEHMCHYKHFNRIIAVPIDVQHLITSGQDLIEKYYSTPGDRVAAKVSDTVIVEDLNKSDSEIAAIPLSQKLLAKALAKQAETSARKARKAAALAKQADTDARSGKSEEVSLAKRTRSRKDSIQVPSDYKERTGDLRKALFEKQHSTKNGGYHPNGCPKPRIPNPKGHHLTLRVKDPEAEANGYHYTVHGYVKIENSLYITDATTSLPKADNLFNRESGDPKGYHITLQVPATEPPLVRFIFHGNPNDIAAMRDVGHDAFKHLDNDSIVDTTRMFKASTSGERKVNLSHVVGCFQYYGSRVVARWKLETSKVSSDIVDGKNPLFFFYKECEFPGHVTSAWMSSSTNCYSKFDSVRAQLHEALCYIDEITRLRKTSLKAATAALRLDTSSIYTTKESTSSSSIKSPTPLTSPLSLLNDNARIYHRLRRTVRLRWANLSISEEERSPSLRYFIRH
ncbi:MAG: hypothetical protein Q9218_004218 [Villophora microphyllina]